MKTALITTTIFTPKVLALYRKLGPNVKFFIALDNKMDGAGIAKEFPSDPLMSWLTSDWQKGSGYSCSELIGWNTVRRRNIALLEALKWGANVIVTIDDDNVPIGSYFGAPFIFHDMSYRRSDDVAEDDYDAPMSWHITGPRAWNGLKATSPSKWFDAGQLMLPRTPHRGFPYDKKAQPSYEPIVDAKIGVAAGLCLGDPDIDAVTRIATAPIVHTVSELARAGVVTDPRETWTVFNTQNTAFIRELAPAMFCAPGLGRFDDIVASLITQRVMRSRGLHVHFGQPFVWQQRNSHNLIRDLEEEVWGMRHLTEIADELDGLAAHSNWSVIEHCCDIWTSLSWPDKTAECALAFLDDCEKVL